MSTWRRVAGVAIVLVLGAAAPSGAALPGRNGTVVYEGKSSSRGVLYLRRSDGRDLRRLRLPTPVSQPSFSPQGRRVAFASLGQVWTMFAEGSGARPLTSGPVPSGSPSWSPRGDAIALARGPSGARDVYAIGADGNGLRQLTTDPGDDHSAAWSARDQIAFVRRTRRDLDRPHRGRADDDVYVMSADGTRQRRLTHSALDDRSPAWSPDGRRIAFTRGAGARHDVYVMTSAGHGVRRLTRRGDVASPAWSPNGRWIVFSAGRSGHAALYVMRSRGGRARRITPTSADARFADWQPTGADPVVAAAGDVACDPADPSFLGGVGTATRCHERQTSDLMLRTDLAAVLALGDLQYEDGQLAKFMQSFDPTWGRLRGIMRPVPGNHEYRTAGAASYFDYFDGIGAPGGPAGDRDKGYYSFDVGAWHLVALNSECSDRPALASGCAAGSAQEQWLRADLAAHPATCTLAFLHHPLASSGIAEVNSALQPIWQALYDGGADVVLAGHDHAYERFAPQTPALAPDPARGIRAFVVGTGGKNQQRAVTTQPNSELRANAFGVLELTLHPTSYDWAFVPDTPGGFADAGSAACH
jgi:acid phosphatase type 7